MSRGGFAADKPIPEPARDGAIAPSQDPALGAILAVVLERLSAGVIVYDGKGECRHVNGVARAIVARRDGLRLDRNGVLHACDRTADRALTRARADLADGRTVRVPRPEGREAYPVLLTPLGGSVGQAGCLVLIHDPDLQFRSMAREIARLFGLPMGPAGVVAALAGGDDLKSYAKQRGLSYNTVRYHLKTAFARTGVRTQSRLVQRVTRALTEFGVRE
jgi:hypothetical protein